MAEYIEREALLAEYDRLHTGEPGRARQMIADAPAVSKWISAKKEKPEPGTEVLVYRAKTGYMEVSERLKTKWRFDSERNPITHWMHLPEPPED